MPDEKRNDSQSLLEKLIAVLEHKILRQKPTKKHEKRERLS
jgi:hypothetical protein